MTRQYDADLGIFKAIIKFVEDNPGAIQIIPVIASYSGELVSLVGSILSASTTESTIGITAVKSQTKILAILIAIEVRNILYNYASDYVRPDTSKPISIYNPLDPKMVKLKEEMKDITETFLQTKKDEELLGYLYNILNKADEILSIPPPAGTPALTIYGMKLDVSQPGNVLYEPGTLTRLSTAIDAYYNITTTPRAAIVKRTTQNKRLKDYIREGHNILEKMDNSFSLLKSWDISLWEGYKNIRKVILPTYTTQIIGTISKVTDAGLRTTEVAPDAEIIITAKPYTQVKNKQKVLVTPEPVITKTDAEGKYAVPVPHFRTTYTVKCGLPGYQEMTATNKKVKLGKKTEVDFLLEMVV